MNNLTFLLVVKFDSQERRDNFDIILAYIKTNFPESRYLICENDNTPFHRTKHINELLMLCETPYAAVWDVDILIDPFQVRRAVELIKDYTLVYPYSLPWCIVPKDKKHLKLEELKKFENLYTDNRIKFSVGGCFIVNVSKYRECGFENENFVDWGPEDRERYWRVRILTGKDAPRVYGPIFHLWHPSSNATTIESKNFTANSFEMQRICRMSQKELITEVSKWAWTKTKGCDIIPVVKSNERNPEMPKRIVTRLGIEDDNKSGRLGNKLFQAAACIGYAEKHGFEIVMPEWKLKEYLPNIKTSKTPSTGYVYVYHEQQFNYKDIPLFNNETISLDGYFQSEKYFEHCKDKVRYYFTPNEKTKKYAEFIYNGLSENGKLRLTVLQVRRDDYIKKSNYHTVQPIEYYKKGIEMLKDKTDKFVVFCDKTAEDWCTQEFNKLGIVWEFSPADNYIGDIFVMARCDNFIIANSTFGYWGAWLSERKDKQVICPINWFGPVAGLNDTDLIPATWGRI